MEAQNASPSFCGPGFSHRYAPAPCTARWCFGAAVAIRALRSVAAWVVGIANRPWVRPWPSSAIENRVFAAARLSSRSRARASWASARPGSATSRIRLPRLRRAFASWSAAAASRCFSARPGRSGSAATARTSGSSSVRSDARFRVSSSAAWQITDACSARTSPRASASLVNGCCSRPAASRVLACASRRVDRVECASPFAVDVGRARRTPRWRPRVSAPASRARPPTS